MRNRRQWLIGTGWAALAWQLGELQSWVRVVRGSQASFKIAPFAFDVTPPLGHSCCGGWIRPVETVDDPLSAKGYVLLGLERPIVICAVDWTGILNSAHQQFRQVLADAAGTTADCVAVQCVHQHNAPFACLDSQGLIEPYPELPAILDREFFAEVLRRGGEAVRTALPAAQAVTHLATSRVQVEQVASNRRVHRNAAGDVIAMRGSSCRDDHLRSLPAGLIDPWMQCVAWYDHDRPVLKSYYYAVHPMSFYADGRVTPDFVGLAREQRQAAEPEVAHLYFTGCAGNIAAGKYNDGSPEARQQLTERIAVAMEACDRQLTLQPLKQLAWRTQALVPQPRESLDREALQQQIANADASIVQRNRPAFALAWLERLQAGVPLHLSSLQINNGALLHLPAECFIEYQLHAQKQVRGGWVATAAYGDGGPWYVPTASEYRHGGYEVSVAYCDSSIEAQLARAVTRLLDLGPA